MPTCLKCGATDVQSGTIATDGRRHGPVFRPDSLRFWTFTWSGGTELTGKTYACLACGLVWTDVDPEDLKAFKRNHCHKQEQR